MQCAAPVRGAATLGEVFAATLARVPDAPALDDGTRVLSYRDLDARVRALAGRLAAAGLRRGDRIGIQLPSGGAQLYAAILAVLALGAAYVPVDHDDPPARTALVFGDAEVTAILSGGRILPGPGHHHRPSSVDETTGSARSAGLTSASVPAQGAAVSGAAVSGAAGSGPAGSSGPGPDDDAWVIFTSGSTGRPKGVAVTHRAAAAFVDGEAARFADPATGRPALGPGDRVLAGLSVAFDASCEEMWLAWRHGACLVSAPRELVRAGVELGDWLATRQITAVSTVPTLAGLWTPAQLVTVRLLILGGEACPEPLAHRLASCCERVWNTYGPTETTVVATATRLRPDRPVRIGRPLPGYQIAVVDPTGQPVAADELGELVIAGAGLGRYLDPDRDAAGYRPLPALGWDRAYYSGDLVRADPRGLTYHGRRDAQIKIRGFRVEPGEVEQALAAQPGIAAAAVVATTSAAGSPELVGYYTTHPDPDTDPDTGPDSEALEPGPLRARLAAEMPAHLVPARLHRLASLPTLTSGKIDRAALAPPQDTPDPGASASHPLPRAEASTEDTSEVGGDADEQTGAAGEADSAVAADTTAVLRGGGGPLRDEPPDRVRGLAEALAGSLGRVLGRGPVPLAAHLFDELGADSLSLAHFCRATREDPALPAIGMRQLYRHPTLARLAHALAPPAPAPPAPPNLGAGAATAEPPAPRRAPQPEPVGAGSGVEPRLPGALRYGLCGLVQAVVLAGLVAGGGALAALGVAWLSGAGGVLELYARAVAAVTASAVGLTGIPVAVKWLLIGRWRPRTIELWSGAHLRLWLVATLTRLAPPVALVGSPLYNLYLRALGARIGPRAVIFSRTVPVVTDLLTVGPDTVIGKRAAITGYRAGRDPDTGVGVIWTGEISIGARAVVGAGAHLDIDTSVADLAHLAHASALHHGQHVPPGRYWHGSPAEPARHHPEPLPAANCPRARRVRYAIGQLAAVLVGLPLLIAAAAVVVTHYPALVSDLDPAAQTGTGFAVHAAQTSLALFVAGLAAGLAGVVVVPRVLSGLVVPGRVYPLYGPAYAAHRALSAISNAPWLLRLFGDSAYITGYLRALGYRAARDGQTGTNFGAALHHETPFLVTVGPGTQVSDDVGFSTAEYSHTAFRTRPVTLGGRSFLGNALTLPPGTSLGEGCFIGTKTHIPAGVTVPDHTGMLGSPPFRIPATRPQDPAGALGPGELAERLRAKTRHNLGTIAWFLLAGWARTYLAVLVWPSGYRAATAVAGHLGTDEYLVGVAVATLAVGIAELGFGIVLERASLGFRPLQPRRCSIYQRYFWVHERFWKLSGNYRMLAGTPLKPLIARLLGAAVGRRVFDDGAGLSETGLVSIGDGAILGARSVLQAHSMEDGEFKSDRITLARHVVLAPAAFVHYGTALGAAAELEPDAFLMKGEAVPPSAVWTGNPAGPTTTTL